MDKSDVLRMLNECLGPAPEFNPAAGDIEVQVEKWKAWSAQRMLIANVQENMRSETLDEELQREVDRLTR